MKVSEKYVVLSFYHLDLVHGPPHLLAPKTQDSLLDSQQEWPANIQKDVHEIYTKEGTKFPQVRT